MILRLSTLFALLLIAGQAVAQSSPFDMSDERPAERTAPMQVEPPRQPQTVTEPVMPEPGPEQAEPFRRDLIPFETLVLPGEIARRAWTIYLTPEQAASPASLNVGYQNAIFVAPEASRLRVSVNGAMLIDEEIASSDTVTDLISDIPPSLLKPGYNLVIIEANMRHRTDCSVASTYDLWTEISPAHTYIEFADAGAGEMRRLEDLRALGVDSAGRTRFTIVVPGTEMAAATEPVLKLSQGLSLLAAMPNQSIRVVSELPQQSEDGDFILLLGPAAALADMVPGFSAERARAATLDFVPDIVPGQSVLVVSGQGWGDINAAIRQVTAPSERPLSVNRTVLSYGGWVYPPAPFILKSARVDLAALGVATSEFSGRRFKTEFNIGIPSDFYAGGYGEVQLLLDAAYSQEILPGSHLDIYVNGNIATTVPLGSGDGAILRQLPVNITMRHFHPGLNEIAIEAVLLTEADAICAPGASASDTMRFALFDTSTLVVPDFARIGTRPNLDAFAGTGFPYNRSPEPVPLVLERGSRETLSAAATLTARLALSAGRIVDFDTVAPLATLPGRSAIFISTLPQVPVGVLAAVGISEQARTSGTDPASQNAVSPGTAAAMDRWSSEVGTNWLRPVERLSEWLSETFDLSFDALRLFPRNSEPYLPAPGVTLMVAQGASPQGGGAWLLVTAPTDETMRQGMESLTRLTNWPQLQGRLASYTPATESFTHIPVSSVEYVWTTSLTFRNIRLIAANALSENILAYAAILLGCSLILGVATALLSRRLGRRQ